VSKGIQRGDIAFIVGMPYSASPLNYRVVRCVEQTMHEEERCWRFDRVLGCSLLAPDYFPLTGFVSAGQQVYLDELQERYLRPIRDQPGEDESLQWVENQARRENAGLQPQGLPA